MPKAVVHAKIDTPAGRSKLKSGRQPHWPALGKNAHPGSRRPGKTTEGKKPGRTRPLPRHPARGATTKLRGGFFRLVLPLLSSRAPH